MGKSFFTLFLLLSTIVLSQVDSTKKDSNVPSEEMPSFPGGETEMMKFVQKNLEYPKTERDNGISGTVYLTFIVDSTGNITNIKSLKYPEKGKALELEAIRVVKKMPKWKPGTKNGIPVNVIFNMPIKFTLRDGASKEEIALVNNTYKSGLEKFTSKDYEKAIADFTKVIELTNNTHIDALYNRGVCYVKLNKLDLACKDFQELNKLGDKEAPELIKKYCK